ncbi:uridine kinase family protein [Polaribacter filamentus]|nr:hypothetical protein [Polaribacter filamentus]
MLIEDKLCDEIISYPKIDNQTTVSICGAADLGKSYLSKKIAESLSKRNLKTNHLTLDSYLMDRKTRNKKGLSGYDIEAYNKKEALNNLIELKNGKSIEFKPYNHKDGEKGFDSMKMNPADILIFDGLHSMHSSFLPYVDITIFIYTKDEYLKKIRRQADLIKRNYTTEFSEKISENEFNLYKTNIESYREKANYLLFLESKWKYKLIKTGYNTVYN